MFWIAVHPSPQADATAWSWHALQFTPRVAWAEGALLLEASGSERLFGGRKRLLRLLLQSADLACEAWAAGRTALEALALLRLKLRGEPRPDALPDGLPLWTLAPAGPHAATLERIGCTTIGQLRALPRAGLARRFGAGLLQAVDALGGVRPERYPWLTLPAEFDQPLELQTLATSAPELLLAGQHLLTRLQAWLAARNLGVLAVELEWTLDLRKLDGRPLPPTERIELRTAQATQDMRPLRRLATEQLARATISAPANQLRLRTLQTVPWGGLTTSLLPEDNPTGEKLHQLVERLSVRLGAANVTVPQSVHDHRPECMQRWLPASTSAVGRGDAGTPTRPATPPDPLAPAWLLREPLRLSLQGDKPCHDGPLQLLTRARRIEAAWWDAGLDAPVLRDYFVARSEAGGLLWIFRERLAADQEQPQWFLHGLYA